MKYKQQEKNGGQRNAAAAAPYLSMGRISYPESFSVLLLSRLTSFSYSVKPVSSFCFFEADPSAGSAARFPRFLL
jgi:hypothetical protein